MKVLGSKKEWSSSDGKVTIYEVVDETGTKHKTMSSIIGEGIGKTFEVEEYQNAKGNTYIRQVAKEGKEGGRAREFKADPIKQESIEWQACLKAAVEAVNNWHVLYGGTVDKTSLADYKEQIVAAVVTFTQTIKQKPETIAHNEEEIMVDQGDFAQVEFEVDLPPVDQLEPPTDIPF